MDAQVKLSYSPRLEWDDVGDEDCAYHVCTATLGPLSAQGMGYMAGKARKIAEDRLAVEVAEFAQLTQGG
jgi:hypothetical protein